MSQSSLITHLRARWLNTKHCEGGRTGGREANTQRFRRDVLVRTAPPPFGGFSYATARLAPSDSSFKVRTALIPIPFSSLIKRVRPRG